MINFKALALTTIIALSGVAVGNSAQAFTFGENADSKEVDSRCYSTRQYEVTAAWKKANCN